MFMFLCLYTYCFKHMFKIYFVQSLNYLKLADCAWLVSRFIDRKTEGGWVRKNDKKYYLRHIGKLYLIVNVKK